MSAQKLQKLELIEPDEHVFLLLGFLGIPKGDLTPAKAVDKFHYVVFQSDNDRLDTLAETMVCHYVNLGKVDRKDFDLVFGDLRTKLILIREHWIEEGLTLVRTAAN